MTGVRDYVALLKLRIAVLLLLVALAGYLVTSGPNVDPVGLLLLFVAGLLASGGASAVNHYLDRDLDRLMARTKDRPVPTGRVPPGQALAMGLVLVTASLAIALLINTATMLFILLGFLVYIVVYTIGLKRRNAANIVIGGFAGSCPALAGSAAATGDVSLGAILIAILVFVWTPGHFWALAYRMRDDYAHAGLPMLPVIMDERTAARWIVASTALVPPFALSFWFLEVSGYAYLAVALAASVVLMALALRFLQAPTPRNAWAGYRVSGPYLAVLLVALIADRMLL